METNDTDESKANYRFGIDIYNLNANHEENIPIERLSIVFQAEIFATSQILLIDRRIRHRIFICSDSKATIAALAKIFIEPAVVWDCMQVLETNEV